MNKDKEMVRHNSIMDKIKNANNREDVPNITPSYLSNYLASIAFFDNKMLTSGDFLNVYQIILDYGFFFNVDVRDKFISILENNYPDKSRDDYINKYLEIANDIRFNNIVKEITARYLKLAEIKEKEDLDRHNNNMHLINSCFDIKELPKVSRGVLASFISRYTKTKYNERIENKYLYGIVDLLIEGYELLSDDVTEELLNIIDNINGNDKDKIFDLIMGNLLSDKRFNYLVEEIRAKEKRVLFIYKNDHDMVMDQINDARRISQLPKGYSISTITGYLSSNSMIYSKGKVIPPGEFINIANLLMDGKLFDDMEIVSELRRIVINYYPDRLEESFNILLLKLSKLPKIYYIAEEVREVLKKQNEFTVRGASNVNVYFIPNPKSPIEGGKFYNCYISRAKNLNLEDILPLKLEDIVPPSMDIDSIEWYVQEYYDPTFKTSGGIILNRDEEIGNVTVFQPSDGKIGITKEEKEKYDELEDLSKRVREIISKKKQETDDMVKLQQIYLLHQQEIDKELADLESRIDILTKKRGSK